MKHLTILAAGLPLALFASCGGGGGSGATSSAPFLLQASFDGSNAASPQPGDALLLFLSDAIELTGAALDGDDLAVSDGALGTGGAAANLIDARTLRVPLGTGARVTPGNTTVAFTEASDAVRALGGGPAPDPSASVTVTQADADAPVAEVLTLNAIDGELAGTGPAGGTLQVPRSGFTIDVAWSDATSGIDATDAVLIVDRDVLTPAGAVRAGTNLLRYLPHPATAGPAATFTVPADVLFPTGDVVLTALNADQSGHPAAARTFRFRTVQANDGIRPTETTQLWYLSFERDIEQFSFEVRNLQPTVVIDGTPNGREDAFDTMAILGLWSDAPLPNVEAGRNSNQVILARLQERITAELSWLFDGADIGFTFDQPGTFPQDRPSIAYSSFPFSQICIAGAAATVSTGTLGAAYYDPNNQAQNDNCSSTSNGDRLGIFTHTLANFGLRSGPSSVFRQTFDPFTPGFQGLPIGDETGDRERLIGTNTDARHDQIGTAIFRYARLIAVVIAHECGHSMGLVANGAMPTGLYGGDPINFPTTATSPSVHIENRSLFPADAQNVMSAAIDFEKALSDDTGFNSLNRAYLREQALYEQK